MIRWQPIAIVALVFSWASACDAIGTIMTFDTLPLGTLFGAAAGDQRGDIVHQEDGIEMSVEQIFVDGAARFLRAEVGGRYGSFFSSHPLDLNNISVVLDFRHIGFAVNQVSLEFVELGPLSNFSVNDAALFELASLQLMPTDIAPGVTAVVANGVITVSGPVDKILVGGQELAIDTILAIPEPSTLLLIAIGGAVLLRHRRRRSSGKSPDRPSR